MTTGGKLLLDSLSTPVPPPNPMYPIIGTVSGLARSKKLLRFGACATDEFAFSLYVHTRERARRGSPLVRASAFALATVCARAVMYTRKKTRQDRVFARGSVALSGARTLWYRRLVSLLFSYNSFRARAVTGSTEWKSTGSTERKITGIVPVRFRVKRDARGPVARSISATIVGDNRGPLVVIYRDENDSYRFPFSLSCSKSVACTIACCCSLIGGDVSSRGRTYAIA